VWHRRIRRATACTNILVEGLKRLEYRGYDSAGIAVGNGDGLHVIKAAGKIRVLESRLDGFPNATAGIAHTRWATHANPTTPTRTRTPTAASGWRWCITGSSRNYQVLKSALEAEGHRFRTETDTEVLAHLVEKHRSRGLKLEEAVRAALADVEGTYGIAVMCADEPA